MSTHKLILSKKKKKKKYGSLFYAKAKHFWVEEMLVLQKNTTDQLTPALEQSGFSAPSGFSLSFKKLCPNARVWFLGSNVALCLCCGLRVPQRAFPAHGCAVGVTLGSPTTNTAQLPWQRRPGIRWRWQTATLRGIWGDFYCFANSKVIFLLCRDCYGRT